MKGLDTWIVIAGCMFSLHLALHKPIWANYAPQVWGAVLLAALLLRVGLHLAGVPIP